MKSLASVNRVLGMNIVYAKYLGGAASFVPIFTMLLMLFVTYAIGGFAGVLYFAAGYMSLLFVSMAVFFAGASASDAYKLTNFVNFAADVQDHVSSIAWAARNYMIYLKVTNAGAMVLLCFVTCGCIMYYAGNTANLFHGVLGLVGLLMGIGLAHLIKAINACAVINMAKTYVRDSTPLYVVGRRRRAESHQ